MEHSGAELSRVIIRFGACVLRQHGLGARDADILAGHGHVLQRQPGTGLGQAPGQAPGKYPAFSGDAPQKGPCRTGWKHDQIAVSRTKHLGLDAEMGSQVFLAEDFISSAEG